MGEAGLVVARFRRHALVESEAQQRYLCQLRRRGLRPVVGDRVQWHPVNDEEGMLDSVHDRSSELVRIDGRGRPETIAANLSQLVIVLAASPTPDWFLLDRYLAAGELANLRSRIVFNKIDLIDGRPAALDVYERIGYATTAISVHEGAGLEPLESALAGERSALIGQSGVGKSSIINVLMGDALQKVGELSEKAGQGRHTTTTAVLHRLPGGGELIDSPGVRDYAPYIESPRDVERGFRELLERRAACRFDDCRHLAEPECAVKAALAVGDITEQRYESYRQLYELTEGFGSRRSREGSTAP